MAWEAKEMPSFHSSAKHKHYKPIKHHPWDKQQHTADAKKNELRQEQGKEGRTANPLKAFKALLGHKHCIICIRWRTQKSR